ncbi:hypothetical protein N7454_005881 [Penicillium verhagenii]|nr:hypothetical protein N7454_005881 [Penicillium verhagenii]
MVPGYYYCVDVDNLTQTPYTLSSTPTPTPTSQSTSSVATTATPTSSGLATPSPVQSGIISTCDAFYLVVSGDTCSAIATAEDISLDDFYTYNPAVGSSCAGLWVGYYVCVGSSVVASSSAITTTSTTSSATGISTPAPIQTGMTSTCDEFYLVVSGDSCAAIAADYGITFAEFYSMNPAVGSGCASLWVGDYVCVASSTISTSSVATTSTVATTTSTSGSGVTTPSPIQTGMVSTCDKFYFVVSGDTCAVIAADYGITFAEFYAWNPAVGSGCASLWVGDYVCVGVTA